MCNIPHCCLPQESGPCLSPSVAGHPLRSATDRRFGGPLPRQLANQTRVHPIPPEFFTLHHAVLCAYAVLAAVSGCYPPVWGRLPTRYSPVRHSVAEHSFQGNHVKRFVRLACVRHAASVHPEPGSNSHVKVFPVQIFSGFFLVFTRIYCFKVLLSSDRSVRLSDISIRQPEISSDPVLLDPLNLSRSVHCSVINVLFCCPPFSVTACLLYHFEPVLSTTFFFFVHFFQSASRSVSGSQLA